MCILRVNPKPDVFIVCFSLVNKTSFNNVSYWIDEIREFCPNTPFIIVGTKSDLRETSTDTVSQDQIEKMSAKFKSKKV